MSLIRRMFVFASLASLICSAPGIEAKDKEKIQPANDANTHFTPLLLPEEAKLSGISLSGEAQMYRQAQGHYQLGCGCVLVHTEEPIYIDTCRANVFARPGATIVVGAKKDATRILNLSDRKHDSVRIIFGKNHVSLNPGEEIAIVSAKASADDKAANEYVIRYRNAQELAPGGDYKALLFEFSLGDAMKHCLIFKQLRESLRQEDQALLKDIIKTAAAVNSMFAKSREQYGHGQQNPQIAKKKAPTKVADKKQQRKSRLALNEDISAQ